jgi:hypothetical protein
LFEVAQFKIEESLKISESGMALYHEVDGEMQTFAGDRSLSEARETSRDGGQSFTGLDNEGCPCGKQFILEHITDNVLDIKVRVSKLVSIRNLYYF